MRTRLLEGLKGMLYICRHEMLQTIKDEGVIIFFIVVPLLYPLLYSWMYNNEVVRDVPVAVVDNSHSQESRRFLRMFDASPDTKVAYYCTNLQEAQELISRKEVFGILYFPSDYARRINRHEQVRVSVYCDMSLMLTYKAIYMTAQSVAGSLGAEIQKAAKPNFTERDEELTVHALEVDEQPIFNTTGGYGNALLPAVLIIIIQQTLLLGIGLGAGTARERHRKGLLIPHDERYMNTLRVVTGKALGYFLVYCVLTAYLTLIVPSIFGFTAIAHGWDLAALMLPYLLSSIFFGMMISCLVRYRENVMLMVVFTSVPLLFMTGISWPETNIPGYWQGISWLFPSTFGARGFLKLSSMGATLLEARTEWIALWTQTAIYFLLACVVYRVQIIKANHDTIS